MKRTTALPLREVSIRELFYQDEKCIYEIPVYQRNYAWEKDEISAIIHDVDDSFHKNSNQVYYIGTLVTYNKGDRVYEVIDGQQRLTTIFLILKVLSAANITNRLTYRARKRSDETLKHIPDFDVDDIDSGIENGYKFAKDELEGIATEAFKDYFLNKVHIIRYMVPRDIDLNHYFEIMNSRGEQLEKHEIVKAKLMQKLSSDEDRQVFHKIWEACSEMNIYLQQKSDNPTKVFGDELYRFIPTCYEELRKALLSDGKGDTSVQMTISIDEILSSQTHRWDNPDVDIESKDTFLPIIDFPNFLLIVLKLVRLSEPGFIPTEFNLDDKELLNEFDKATMNESQIKQFSYILMKARFLLDNYIVHHSKEEDSLDSNPWKLQVWHKDKETKKEMLRNLVGDRNLQPLQNRLVHLLSMFEVSFTARQRKNYLLYCFVYLMNVNLNDFDFKTYAEFLEKLAFRYFNGVYLSRDKLSDANKPMPGSFDEIMLFQGGLSNTVIPHRDSCDFNSIYGDGSTICKGLPLYIFNYTDYLIWKYYDSEVRGEKLKEGSRERKEFFDNLGCSDFGLKVFDQFYFSRTRRSLEHYYPQNQATGENGALNQAQINCFGNFAMIGSEANSSGSDWSPMTKLDHYLDSSKKISRISVASLKFMIMMQRCRDGQKWDYEDIKEHQKRMLDRILKESMN